MKPKSPIQQNSIVRFYSLVVVFSSSQSLDLLTFHTEAFLSGIDAAEELIPYLEIEACVIRLILDRHSMMKIVLEGGIDNGMMGVGIREFMAPMKIDSVTIEECCKLNRRGASKTISDRHERGSLRVARP